MTSPKKPLVALLLSLAVLALASCGAAEPGASYSSYSSSQPAATPTAADSAPPAATGLAQVKHVFVIMLENEDYDAAFSGSSYLAKRLPSKGQLLTQYYGTGHHSLDNYISLVSGQAPDPATQGDCVRYTNFAPKKPRVVAPGQVVGNGCVYPSSVKTVGDQLIGAGLSWRAYLEGMGSSCRHPRIGALDPTRVPTKQNQYATKHNPFMYFHSVIDQKACSRRDVPLSKLPAALQKVGTTAQLSLIVPDMCDDGHEAHCPDGRPGGMKAANAWLRVWVPRILASPAYTKGGMLVVTFDEADSSAKACCHEKAGPNAAMPGLVGRGGGRIGAVVLSPFVKPGSRNATPYNHYSLLATIEDVFGLKRLGYARGAEPFGSDVLAR